jgi:hypothetical protein
MNKLAAIINGGGKGIPTKEKGVSQKESWKSLVSASS